MPNEKLTFSYGGKTVTFNKSQSTFAVKSKGGKKLPASRGAQAAKEVGQWDDFILMDVDTDLETTSRGGASPVEEALDNMRGMDEIDVGTHVFHFEGSDAPLVPTGGVHVIFEIDADDAKCKSLFAKHHLNVVRKLADNEFLVQISEKSRNPLKVSAQLQQEEEVEVAEPNFIREVQEYSLPTDNYFKDQWHLENEGPNRQYWVGGNQGIFSSQYFKAGADAKVVEAWKFLESKGRANLGSKQVTIAVIDPGAFDIDHPDLRGDGTKIVAPRNFEEDTTNPRPSRHGQTHGTACAGVAIGAATGSGIVGACPNAKFMPITMKNVVDDWQAEEWLMYAMNNGADIISCSWGWPAGHGISTFLKNALRYITTHGRGGKGCIICFAAGNANPSTNYQPVQVTGFAADPNIICVTASSSSDTVSEYSFFGAEVCVAAPSSANGYAAITTCFTSPDWARDPGSVWLGTNGAHYTSFFGGTSSSCPLVAGICGLLLSLDSGLMAKEVKQLLANTADKVTDPNTPDSGYVNGHSRRFGYGKVNALEALKAIRTGPGPTPFFNKATVNAGALNVRRGPSTTYEKVGLLHRGDEVSIWSRHGLWIKIGNEQYVHANYLTFGASSGGGSSETGVVNANRLNVRRGPGMDFSISGKLDRGDRVSVLEKNGNWLKIGNDEFVHQRYVTFT